MRTTIDLPEPLLRQAKQDAAQAGITLASFLEDALREKLHRKEAVKKEPPFVFPVFVGEAGLRKGVDLRSNREMFDLLEEDE